MDQKALIDAAVTGTGALQKVYGLHNLNDLEADMHDVLGAQIKVQDNYVNAGPDAKTAERWSELLARFERDDSAARLEKFAEADFALMKRLGLTI